MRIFTAFRARVLTIAIVVASLPSCGGGHDASRVVKAEQGAVYAAFDAAFSANSLGGSKQYADLWHGGMQTEIERTPDSRLDVITKFDGETATEAHFTFTPKDGGKATLVEADVTVDPKVMSKAFAGTAHERLGSLAKVAFAQGMQRLMAKYADRIESGIPITLGSEGWTAGAGEPPSEFYEGMPDEMRAEIRRHDDQERQETSAAPTLDPNADAQAYLHPTGSSD